MIRVHLCSFVVRLFQIDDGRVAVKCERAGAGDSQVDRKSTRLNSSHSQISYAVFCLKKKTKIRHLLVTLCPTHLSTGRPTFNVLLASGHFSRSARHLNLSAISVLSHY